MKSDATAIQKALSNLRQIAWGIAEMQMDRDELFEYAEFAPRSWSPAHGVSPAKWNEYRRAFDAEYRYGYRRRWRGDRRYWWENSLPITCKRSEKFKANILKSRARKKRHLRRYAEIIEHLKSEWKKKVHERTP